MRHNALITDQAADRDQWNKCAGCDKGLRMYDGAVVRHLNVDYRLCMGRGSSPKLGCLRLFFSYTASDLNREADRIKNPLDPWRGMDDEEEL